MAARDYDLPMAVVRKNQAESIKIFLRKAQDGSYLDMRIWSQAAFGAFGGPELEMDGGLTLDLELLPDLIQALDWVMETAMELKEIKKGRPRST